MADVNEDLNAKKSQMHTALCMGFVFICIGIPIWWKTTEVYRAELPYAAIQELSENTTLATEIKIKLASSTEEQASLIYNAFSSATTPESSSIHIKYAFERVVLSEATIQALYDDDTHGNDTILNSGNNYLVIIRPNENFSRPRITLTSKRAIFFDLPSKFLSSNIQELPLFALKLFTETVVNMVSLEDIKSKAYGTTLDFPKEREAHIMKTIRSNKGYDIVFSMLCPEPDKLQMKWDIEEATRNYLGGMISKLGNFAEFHVRSQILYYSGLSVRPKVDKSDAKNKIFYLTHRQLSHVINPIESRLGSQISPNPALNFVIYVTEERYTPLYIQKEDGSLSATNTFLIPRWGAIKIQNSPAHGTDVSSVPRFEKIDSKEMMEVFLAQLRVLLGIEEPVEFDNAEVVMKEAGPTALRDWELDYLVRTRIVENIATSIHTLNSLAQLLEKIHNIVINDNIAKEVYSAVEAVYNAKESLHAGNLEKALNYSNIAFRSSEIAFFDPTLLELLYFPEDQKFAIYIPLFLPIALPLLGSFISALKWLKQRNKEKDE